MSDHRVEVRLTQFTDPDVKSGPRTNGPRNVFIREDDSCPWYAVVDFPYRSAFKIHKELEAVGFHAFVNRYCEQLES